MSPRPRPSSPAPPAATLPEDDDLLEEFLVRLAPSPSSLLRASLVCKRWRRLLSDPRFHRKLRARHGAPPLLGVFYGGSGIRGTFFDSTLARPDRIPSWRFSRAFNEQSRFFGCRHGLALLLDPYLLELTVLDPFTGDKRRAAVPPAFRDRSTKTVSEGAVLCDNVADRAPLEAFKVVLLCTDNVRGVNDNPQVFASLYESETGAWSDPVSASIRNFLFMSMPGILVGNSLCWLHLGNGNGGVLEFDLDRHTLSVISNPGDAYSVKYSTCQILRMEDSRLGLAIFKDESMQMWERKADSYGAAKWSLQRTIELDKLLPLPRGRSWLEVQGYDEDGDTIFIWTSSGVFMIQLKSMQFRKIFNKNAIITIYHPYRRFCCPTGRDIGSGGTRAETLSNT